MSSVCANTACNAVPGRPRLGEPTKSRYRAARALRLLHLVEEECDNTFLMVTRDDAMPAVAEAQQHTHRRYLLAALEEEARCLVVAARKGGDGLLSRYATQQKQALHAAIDLLPPIGHTEAEWMAIRAHLKTPVGRPTVSLESRLAKQRMAYRAQLEVARRHEAQQGEPPAEMADLIAAAYNPKIGKPGKPIWVRRTQALLNRVKERIAAIESGEAARDQQEHLQARMAAEGVDDPTQLRGRRFSNLEERLPSLRMRRDALEKKLRRPAVADHGEASDSRRQAPLEPKGCPRLREHLDALLIEVGARHLAIETVPTVEMPDLEARYQALSRATRLLLGDRVAGYP